MDDFEALTYDLTDGTNIHPTIHTIATAARTLLNDIHAGHLTIADTQLLLAQASGSADATDLVGLIAALLEAATSPANPALAGLPEATAKEVQHQGELAAYALRDPELRNHTAAACAALDNRKD